MPREKPDVYRTDDGFTCMSPRAVMKLQEQMESSTIGRKREGRFNVGRVTDTASRFKFQIGGVGLGGILLAFILGFAQYGDWVSGLKMIGFVVLLILPTIIFALPIAGIVVFAISTSRDYFYNWLLSVVNLTATPVTDFYLYLYGIIGVIISGILGFIIIGGLIAAIKK